MKILLPFKKDQNPYLDELIIHSGHEYVYAKFQDYVPDFSVVNIHWPEALFNWREPSSKELRVLEEHIKKWKKNSVIVYTKHDEIGHKKMTPNFQKLFDIIEESTDIFIHLGNYSKSKYKIKYPNVQHVVVEHPLYEHSFYPIPKDQARNLLGISQDSFVVVAPGKIRSKRERKMILRSFALLPEQNKVLICTNMRADSEVHFPGRVRLKKIFDIKKYREQNFMSRYRPPGYFFDYNSLEKAEFGSRISAADIVLVPRLNTLNSGNPFLGFTFRKIVVGPAIGNIEEHLVQMGMPTFDPRSLKSVVSAIQEGKALSSSKYYPGEENLERLKPKFLSEKLDEIFELAVL